MNLVDIQVALLTDELDETIRGMLDFDSKHNNGKLQNQIIHQSGRYHGNEKSNNIGTISSENYNRTRNQLRYALQELMKKFPGYGPEVNAQANAKLVKTDNTEPHVEDTSFKVLMLTSNPVGTDKLQLAEEHSRISVKIQNAVNANQFPIKSRWAVTFSEFTEALVDEMPNIVHFSGHGENNHKATVSSGSHRGQGLDEENSSSTHSGIYLTDEDGRDPIFVNTGILEHLFKNMIELNEVPIKIVIFNSCYSEEQASALAAFIPHVIGTSSAIKDKAAIAFATGFYSFLIRGKGIKSAWSNGVTQAMLHGEPKDRFIYYKDGKKVER